MHLIKDKENGGTCDTLTPHLTETDGRADYRAALEAYKSIQDTRPFPEFSSISSFRNPAFVQLLHFILSMFFLDFIWVSCPKSLFAIEPAFHHTSLLSSRLATSQYALSTEVWFLGWQHHSCYAIIPSNFIYESSALEKSQADRYYRQREDGSLSPRIQLWHNVVGSIQRLLGVVVLTVLWSSRFRTLGWFLAG